MEADDPGARIDADHEQIKRGGGNQSFDTFNTLNIFVLKGDGAAGMDAILR